MSAVDACLDPFTLTAWVEGQLDETTRQAAVKHIGECDICRATAASLFHLQADSDALVVTARGTDAAVPMSDLPHDAPVMVGRYQLGKLLGVGGMGSVYEAHDPQLKRSVAVKILRDPGPGAAQRIEREAQALAKLAHPHVVAIYDTGVATVGHYIVMQLIDGQTLDAWLVQHRNDPMQVLRCFAMAGAGLVAAHAANLVHRDFKPQNVLVDRAGTALVTDFGLAKEHASDPILATDEGSRNAIAALATATTASNTAGAFAGTPMYMAPEHYLAEPVTALSDQFAFCVALWEALFDAHPFVETRPLAGNVHLVGAAVCAGKLREPPRGHNVPTRVVNALKRGLATKPTDRWPSMVACLAQLTPTPPRTRRTVVLAVAAASLTAAGVSYLVASSHPTSTKSSTEVCQRATQTQLATSWGANQRTTLQQAFAQTQLRFASTAATTVVAALDGYAQQWTTMRTDLCVAEARNEQPQPGQALCLDEALRSLNQQVKAFSDRPGSRLVANALQSVHRLPALRECLPGGIGTIVAQAQAWLPNLPLLAQRALISSVESLTTTGQYTLARQTLKQLLAVRDAINDSTLHNDITMAKLVLAAAAGARDIDAQEINALVAALLKNNQVRAASRALSLATTISALDRNVQAMRANGAWSIALAEQLGDIAMARDAKIALGRGLVALDQNAEGFEQCAAVLATMPRISTVEMMQAVDAVSCQLFALSHQGKFRELHELTAKHLPLLREVFGEQHPMYGEWLAHEADSAVSAGDFAAARKLTEQAQAIFTAAYGAQDLLVLQTRHAEARITFFEFKYPAALAKLEAVIADMERFAIRHPVELSRLYADCAMVLEAQGNAPAQAKAIARAIEVARAAGPYAEALVAQHQLIEGQFRVWDDPDAGIAELAVAQKTLQRLNDPQAKNALFVLGFALANVKRYAEAIEPLEQSLRDAATIKDSGARNTAMLEYALARSLRGTKRDPARAKQLAQSALRSFRSLKIQDEVRDVEAFLAQP